MKKALITVAAIAALSTGYTFAADTAPWDPTLHQAASCAEVETAVKSYLENRWNGWYFSPMMRMEDSMGGVSNAATPWKDASNPAQADWIGGWWWDYSTTNVQKAGVDEPEIIKTNGKNIYYLDQSKWVLRILDVQTQKELSSLVLPKDYWNAQLLINGDKLILIGSKSMPYYAYDASYIARDQQALIAVYSISQATPKLIQAYTFDGYFQDSRVVDNQLVLISSQSLNRWPVYKLVNNGTQWVSPSSFAIKAQDILPKWSTLVYATVKNRDGTSRVVTRKKTTTIDCSQVLYKKSDVLEKNSNSYGGEWLTTVISLPLNNVNAKPQIKTVMSNSSQIHVSQKSLYITTPTYMRQPFSCPINAMCLPWRGQGQYTTVHGFDLNGIGYKYSTVVPGNTRNQYSMDENTDGKFRIVTSNNKDWKINSNVYILNTNGKVAGSLENIAPGEQFYGVRFIGAQLYLVTYRQVDPLFVIDTTDTTKPKVIGELKMPWYSTYLHPYGALKDWVQYLIGLGYDTKTSPEWWEQQVWVKLDLYKVDFNNKDSKWKVAVSQVWTRTLWQAGSQTDALYNPRMFVFNQTTKELLLPIVLAETKKVQSCNIVYDMEGKEVRKDCYPYDQAVTTFAGVKWWTLGMDNPFETISVDYKSVLKNPYPSDIIKPMAWDVVSTSMETFIDPRWFSSLQSRVGYNGGQYYFVWNQFANFFTKADQKGTMITYK